MIRSRVTLATTDAALMQAATRSPFHTASPGRPSPSTGKPSVRTYCGATSSSATARRSASMFATCMPSRSHSSDSMTTTDHDSARLRMWCVAALARLLGEQLGVGQPGDLAGLAGPQDRGAGDQRPGARSTTGLVDAGHEIHAHAAQGALVAVEPGVAPDGRSVRQPGHEPFRALVKSAGRCSRWKRFLGHSSTKTLPTTSETGT